MEKKIISGKKETKKLTKGIFIFRRDFRLVDNIGLLELSKKCDIIYPIFIFTPEQVHSNPYKSDSCVQFMIESLISLDSQIKNIGRGGGDVGLQCFYGKNKEILQKIINDVVDVSFVGFNRDYTPYAKKRDESIIALCETMNIETIIGEDYYLHVPGSIMNSSGNPYQKFTPYYNIAKSKHVNNVHRATSIIFSKLSIDKHIGTISLSEAMERFCTPLPDILVHGGLEMGKEVLRKALHNSGSYAKNHNILSWSTTNLSAYIKFGIFSIRQIYHSFSGHSSEIIRQLIWRDFYAQLLHFFPEVLDGPMKPAYKKMNWHKNTRWFNAWKSGKTGFPVVDACMRQLNTTGFCHNRGRLIVASFLVKTLLIDWQEGEKYFAKKLTDYDPASNNLNWQWVASSAVDSQPYFRIFNPWSQGKEFDKDCEYIKKWIPELKDVAVKDIHKWDTKWEEYTGIHYPKPICDYSAQKELALKMYSDIYRK